MIAARGTLLGMTVALALAPTACSAPTDDKVAPVTTDEARAVSDARAMIPASELPTDTPSPAFTESTTR